MSSEKKDNVENIENPSVGSHPDDFKKSKFESLSRKIRKKILRNNGPLQQLYRWFIKLFTSGPRPEIYHDWLYVNSIFQKAIYCAESEGKLSPGTFSTLATIQAYLELARYERNFAKAWSYINLAITLLPLVVKPEELASVTFRLQQRKLKEKEKAAVQDWISKLVSIQSQLKLTKEEKDDEKSQLYILQANTLVAQLEREIKACTTLPRYSKAGKEKESDSSDNREQDKNQLHFEQINEAQMWNVKNLRIALKLSLWKSVGSWFLLSLLIALAIAVCGENSFKLRDSPYYRYIFILLLGFFGGGLSALLTARQTAVRIVDWGLLKAYMILRMLLGAAGSFVVYIIVQAISLGEISKDINTNFPVFLALGIAAGFSERLFIKALEKISENLSPGVGDSDKEEKEKAGKEDE